jgi:hypothetical protein
LRPLVRVVALLLLVSAFAVAVWPGGDDQQPEGVVAETSTTPAPTPVIETPTPVIEGPSPRPTATDIPSPVPFERVPRLTVTEGKSVEAFAGDLLVAARGAYSTFADIALTSDGGTCATYGSLGLGGQQVLTDLQTGVWYRATLLEAVPTTPSTPGNVTLRIERGSLPAPTVDTDCA